MINFLEKNKHLIIRGLFIIPILLVAVTSISHVIGWYGLTNTYSWAIYLSVAIEIAAMVSLAAASARIKGGVWFVFILVTFIQLVGNIFYSYNKIDTESKEYKNWVELSSPAYEMIGLDVNNELTNKRMLALLSGGILPLISLASLHFFMKYEKNKNEEDDIVYETTSNDKVHLFENDAIESEYLEPKNDVIEEYVENSIEDISESNEEYDIKDTNEYIEENSIQDTPTDVKIEPELPIEVKEPIEETKPKVDIEKVKKAVLKENLTSQKNGTSPISFRRKNK